MHQLHLQIEIKSFAYTVAATIGTFFTARKDIVQDYSRRNNSVEESSSYHYSIIKYSKRSFYGMGWCARFVWDMMFTHTSSKRWVVEILMRQSANTIGKHAFHHTVTHHSEMNSFRNVFLLSEIIFFFGKHNLQLISLWVTTYSEMNRLKLLRQFLFHFANFTWQKSLSESSFPTIQEKCFFFPIPLHSSGTIVPGTTFCRSQTTTLYAAPHLLINIHTELQHYHPRSGCVTNLRPTDHYAHASDNPTPHTLRHDGQHHDDYFCVVAWSELSRSYLTGESFSFASCKYIHSINYPHVISVTLL